MCTYMYTYIHIYSIHIYYISVDARANVISGKRIGPIGGIELKMACCSFRCSFSEIKKVGGVVLFLNFSGCGSAWLLC